MSGKSEEKIETEVETGTVAKTEKMKDWWDKAKICGFIAIPIVVAIVGGIANFTLKKKDVEVRMLELAVGILKEDPKDRKEESKDKEGEFPLRQWAISIINKYSSVKLPPEAEEKLKKNPLPESVTWGMPSTSSLGVEVAWAKDIMSSLVPVSILSQPTGAEVYVDGKLIGKTNLMKMMSPGEYSVKLKLNKEEHVEKVKPTENNLVTFDFINKD